MDPAGHPAVILKGESDTDKTIINKYKKENICPSLCNLKEWLSLFIGERGTPVTK